MALARLKADLEGFVQSMYKEGVLDSQFAQIQGLQDASNPNFVVEVITLFCDDAERILTEMNKHLGQPDVDYYKLDAFVHQLKGSSSSIGAQRMKLACVDFSQASENKNKERFLQALNRISGEYCILKNKFQTFIQLEQRILAFETNQQFQNSKEYFITVACPEKCGKTVPLTVCCVRTCNFMARSYLTGRRVFQSMLLLEQLQCC